MTKANEALNKMAENARELGLDYEPAQQEPWCMKMNGCTTKCEDCPVEVQPAQQEPVGSVYRYGKDSSGTPWHGISWNVTGLNLPDGTLIYTSPPAQRTWVGLTIGEIQDLIQFKEHSPFALAEDIEAKLKEKNT